MAKIRFAHKNEKIGSGAFFFMNTDVVYGDDGISGLDHYVPLAQGDWTYAAGTGTATYANVYDAATSRVYASMTALTTGTVFLRKRILLPKDFGNFMTNSLGIITYRSAPLTFMRITFYKAGSADASINGASIEPSVSTTWEAFSKSPTSSYAAGDFVTLEVSANHDTIGDESRYSDVTLLYSNLRGNVS